MKYLSIFFFAFCLLIPLSASATSPMISSISNQTIPTNSSTPALPFTISDNENSPYDLTLTYKSSNRDLVPQNSSNIILGGSGTTRTVQVIPVEDQAGTAVITITVKDLDGDSTDELFTVEVQRPPR